MRPGVGMFGAKPPEKPAEKKPEPEPEPDRELTELEMVFGWRMEQLIIAGYPVRYAQRLALHLEVDLHEAERLMDLGCEPKHAVEILL